MDFLDVEFLSSPVGFCTTFLKIVAVVKASTPPHDVKLWSEVNKCISL